MKWRWVLALSLLGALFLVACGGGGPATQSAPIATPTLIPGITPKATQPAEGAVRIVEVTLSFVVPRFQPNPIVLKVGEPVQFKVISTDTTHTFTIEDLGIDVEIPPKVSAKAVSTKVVTPQETGTFRIFCRIHFRLPMEGALEVTETGAPGG